ncbi:MAG: hypothetical protein DHS20C05_22080 [Hyphococcus sp.]|nr:MAG: hypothetical protein DHS20C05_22080 [Marinicaulis sp.]
MKLQSILLSAAVSAGAVWAVIAAPVTAEDAVDARIGPEVDRICFASSIDRWQSLKGQDGVILLDRGANNWYHVTLNEGCSEKIIKRADAIVLESTPGSGCLTQNDRITVKEIGGIPYQCRVRKMHQWDHTAPAPDEEETGEDA